MIYQGSKARYVNEFLPLMFINNSFVDVFCGGANVVCEVENVPRYANDANEYLIALLKKMQEGLPFRYPSLWEYQQVRDFPERYEPWYVGYVGVCSFRGRYFEGYPHGGIEPFIKYHDNMVKQAPKLKGVRFTSVDYRELVIDDTATIYLDPPYFGTKGYKDDFSHVDLYKWLFSLPNENIYVSEYNVFVPDRFELVWSKYTPTVLGTQGAKDNVEKLFKVKR